MADLIGGERAMISPCALIQESAATLASLGNDDAEKIGAYAHARACRECAEALSEGQLVMAWIDAALAEPSPARPEATETRDAQNA